MAALGLLTVASAVLSVLGIGTGDGPLGPPPHYGAGIARDVGGEFTEGGTFLRNDGWFTVHIESVRPLPVGDAATGMPITAVELVPASPSAIGMVDGAGYDALAEGVRSEPAGFEVQPERRVGKDNGYVEILVRAKVAQPGAWRYRGYEVAYRSGWVKHRMVVDADLQACTPAGSTCLDALH